MRSYGDSVDMTRQAMQGHNHSGLYSTGTGTEGDIPWKIRWGADLAHMPGYIIDAHRRGFMDEAVYDPGLRPQSPEETKKTVPVRFRVKSPEELGLSYVDVKNRKKIYIDGLPVVYPVDQVLDADMVYTGEAWISENSGRISSVLFTDVSGNLRVIQSIIADIQEFLDVVPKTGV